MSFFNIPFVIPTVYDSSLSRAKMAALDHRETVVLPVLNIVILGSGLTVAKLQIATFKVSVVCYALLDAFTDECSILNCYITREWE